MNKIIPIYKKVGETPLEAVRRLREDNPDIKDEIMGYAGRLDPMAEGLLLIMVGEANKKREEFLSLNKTYILQILFGLQTDTQDALGLITKTCPDVSLNSLSNHLESFKGKFKQKYPSYSSKPVNGKPLFRWAREGLLDEIEVPYHEVEIHDIQNLGEKNIANEQLLSQVLEKISFVKGDFRQKEIAERWREILREPKNKNFKIVELKIDCSSGTYMRVLANDLSERLGTCGIALGIKRVRVGDYDLADL